ncbi:MAG: NadS family protein [Gammaproteobacteria bacterium]|nr:MAG: NadS family protein [Gammaproteobacteria bacterium]
MDDATFEELLASIEEAGEIKKGKRKASRRRVYKIDVKAIRDNLGLSQNQFAHLIGVSTRTLQNWEQGRRRPQGPALALLKIVKEDPGSVKALHVA